MAYSQTQFQLTHLLQRVYRRLKVARTSIATNGSTTTIVDSKLADMLNDSNEDDYLNNWTVIVTEDSAGAGADPEGKFNRVSDYVSSTYTITVPDTLTTAVASGDKYMYISPDFPLYDMIEIVNDSLTYLGNIPRTDTSITTAAAQTEYTLPLAVKGNELLDVELQGQTTDANDNQWTKIPNWQIVPAVPGTTGLLLLPQLTAGYNIRLTYLGLHPRVNDYDDYISEFIHPELAVACVTAHAVEWYNTQRNGADRYWLQREDRAWNQLDIARSNYPVSLPPMRVQGLQVGRWHEV